MVDLGDLPDVVRRSALACQAKGQLLSPGTFDEHAHAAFLNVPLSMREAATLKAAIATFLLTDAAQAAWPDKVHRVQDRFGPQGNTRRTLMRILDTVRGVDPFVGGLSSLRVPFRRHIGGGMKAELEAARAEVAAAQSALASIAAALDGAIQSVPNGASIPVAALPPASDHRRIHRPGRPAKIDGDPELRAFLEARVERMTFEELATEVRAHFPKDRYVAKSAIHVWAGRAGFIPKR